MHKVTRKVTEAQLLIDQIPFDQIYFDLKSRDDIPKYLYGLKCILDNDEMRGALFALLERWSVPEKQKDRGYPEMNLWRILVLAGLKQTLRCDYDRLGLFANSLRILRQMMGHGDEDSFYYSLETIQNNVSSFSPELLEQVNQLITEVRKKGRRTRRG